MNATISPKTLPAWPHGILVEITTTGILLKPRPKPRQNWEKRFKLAPSSNTEDQTLQDIKNEFDDKEWEW